MAFKPFGLEERAPIPDSVRRDGFKSFGTKGFPGPYYNSAIFEASQDHVLGTQAQVTLGQATCYYAATADFRDKDNAVVTFVAYDRINIVIDQMERDIVFPAVKLEFIAHSQMDMNGFDITVSGECGGRIENSNTASTISKISITNQSNAIKVTGSSTNLSLKDTETIGGSTRDLFWDGGYIVVAQDGAVPADIRTYSISGTGALTLVDTLTTTDNPFTLASDGTFIFVGTASGSGTLTSAQIDGSGNITLKDTDLTETNNSSVAVSKGFVIAGGTGATYEIRSLSVDVSGVMTQVDKHGTSDINTICADDDFIYGADSTGIHEYKVDVSGNITKIGTNTTVTYPSSSIKCAISGDFLYVSDGSVLSTSLNVYSINRTTGVTTYIYTEQMAEPNAIFPDGFGELYVSSTDSGGFFNRYEILKNGTLSLIETINTGTGQFSIYGSNSYIFAGDRNGASAAIRNYLKSTTNIDFTGTGSVFVSGRLIER